MTPRFLNLPFAGTSCDGQNWTAAKPLEFLRTNGRTVRAAIGTTTDGPSIPLAAQPLTPKFGPIWVCGVLHDAAYRGTLEMLSQAGEWRPYTLTKEEADGLLVEAMQAQAIPKLVLDAVFEAVHLCGHGAFEQDREMPQNQFQPKIP